MSATSVGLVEMIVQHRLRANSVQAESNFSQSSSSSSSSSSRKYHLPKPLPYILSDVMKARRILGTASLFGRMC